MHFDFDFIDWNVFFSFPLIYKPSSLTRRPLYCGLRKEDVLLFWLRMDFRHQKAASTIQFPWRCITLQDNKSNDKFCFYNWSRIELTTCILGGRKWWRGYPQWCPGSGGFLSCLSEEDTLEVRAVAWLSVTTWAASFEGVCGSFTSLFGDFTPPPLL